MFKDYFTENKSIQKKFVEDVTPWSYFVAPGIVFHKKGLYQRSFEFRGPDLEAAPTDTIVRITELMNKIIIEMGEFYAWQFEVQRYKTSDYPGGRFNSEIAYLVDREREATFTEYGEHFETRFYMTISWLPPSSIEAKAKSIFSKKEDNSSIEEEYENINNFIKHTDEIAMYMATEFMIEALNDDETLTFLHTSISLDWYYLYSPKDFFLIDEHITDSEIDVGNCLKIGEKYAPILAVNEFPSDTIPLMLDNLNRADIEYRWVTRFAVAGEEEGSKLIKKYQKSHAGKKKSTTDLFMRQFTDTESGREDHGASALEHEVNVIQTEYALGMYGLGQYISNLMVWDENYNKALKKRDYVKQIIRTCGFVSKEETLNALSAFQSMMPGGVYSNIRRHTVTTKNLSHIVPLSAVWAGQKNSRYLSETVGLDVPLIVTNTSYGTPFYFSPWIGDVGHFTILGPTGAGKSTLIGLTAMSFLKYEGGRVVLLDVGDSARKMTMAVNGKYYKPGIGLGFQPLRELEGVEDITWASEFLEILYSMQNIELNATMRKEIHDTLKLLKSDDKDRRTLTTFQQQIKYTDPKDGSEPLKDGLQPYIIGSQYGEILDHCGEDCNIDGEWTMLEMQPLMAMGQKIVVPVLFYIFRILDRKFQDKKPTLFIMDEAWRMISDPLFIKKVKEWLKTLRKNNVAVGLATQELNDINNSEIASTVIEACLTKIYLANPMAKEAAEVYRRFGLNSAEINKIAQAQMKKDYFYKSPLGVRLFQLDLGPIMLSLTGTEDEEYFEKIQRKNNETEDKQMYEIILEESGVSYEHYFE